MEKFILTIQGPLSLLLAKAAAHFRGFVNCFLQKNKEMGKDMNPYQFEQITRRMEQKYGKMRKNEEDRYAMLLFPMESNLLKIHRKEPGANSRRLEEAVLLALYEVENRTEEKSSDVSSYENKENRLLKEALLKAFDPFANDEIAAVLRERGGAHLEDKEFLFRYYKEPVMCVLRIKESVEYWIKRGGTDGYFDFLERWFGDKVPDDNKMNYSIYAGAKNVQDSNIG